MRVLALLLSVFILSGCATADYYKYLTSKEQLAFEAKKLEQTREASKEQLAFEAKKLEHEIVVKNIEAETEKAKYEF